MEEELLELSAPDDPVESKLKEEIKYGKRKHQQIF